MRPRWKRTRRCGASSGGTRRNCHEAFVRRLAKASGIETPTRAELARFERSRKNRKTVEQGVEVSAGPEREDREDEGRSDGHENVRKRVLIQAAGCNLGLLLRRLTGVGTPRSLQGRALSAILGLIGRLIELWERLTRVWAAKWAPAALVRSIRSSPSCVAHAANRLLPRADRRGVGASSATCHHQPRRRGRRRRVDGVALG